MDRTVWLLGDHRKLRQAVPAGLAYALIASILDDYGVSLSLWHYPEQPIPLLTGNAVWNIVAAAPEATLLAEHVLVQPGRMWAMIIGLALANAAAEWFALATTNLLRYPHWSPLLSIPVYILILRFTVALTRWLSARSAPWKPPH